MMLAERITANCCVAFFAGDVFSVMPGSPLLGFWGGKLRLT